MPVLLLILGIAFPAWTAHASEGHFALVIGNGRYQFQPPLANAIRDARLVAGALEQIGFTVERREDLSRVATLDTLLAFADRVREAEVVLVYYAGHGIQVTGRDGSAENYLVPVDARMSDARNVADETISLTRVLGDLAGRGALLVLLDACRNNPLAAQMPGQGTRASIARGLARIPEGVIAQGSLLAFAAMPGNVAEDGDGLNNGPFAAALVQNLPTLGVDIGLILQRVSLDVETTTAGRQRPEVVNRLRRREPLYLAGPVRPTSPQPHPPADPSPPVPDSARANATAAFRRGAIYDQGHGAPQDFAEAARWYRLAAQQGHAPAQFNLGSLYEQGQGVPKDFSEALRWYRLAANSGHAKAQTSIGRLYESGQGVKHDYVEALRWYRLAADQGHPTAQLNIGIIYANGLGVPMDIEEALRWLRKAEMSGSGPARDWIRRLGG